MLGQADAGPMALHTQPAQAPTKVIDRHLSFDKSEKKIIKINKLPQTTKHFLFFVLFCLLERDGF